MLTRFRLATLDPLPSILFCVLGLAACQSTTIIEEENPRTAGDHYVHFRVADRAALPDSIWYHSSLDSGTSPISTSQEGKEFRVHLIPYLQPLESRDSLAIHAFRLGVHLGTYQAKELDFKELGTNRGTLSAADSLGIALFSVLDSLNAADSSLIKGLDTSKSARRAKLHRIASACIYKGHPKLNRYRRIHPVGLDTSDILLQVLGLASTSNLTLGESVSRWHLGMDYSSARAALASLGLDSLSSNPFRVETPWKLESLHQGESFAEVKGSIVGRKGIQRLDVSVWTDSGDKSQGFIFSDLPDLKSHPQRIDLSGRKILATRPGTPTGSYRIQMIVEDSIGNQQSYQIPFRVEGPLDHRGPSIRWISPRANHVREYSDSLVAVRVEATDSSGIDKVFIGDSLATDSSGISRSSWIVPVSELGTTLRVRALDKAGNQTDSTLVLTRRAKPQPEGPALELIKPIMGSMVRTEEDSTEILWKATLTNGAVDSVWIQDRPARKDAQGAWFLHVSLPPTGKPIVVPIRARGSNGLESRNFVQVGRHRDTIGPVLAWGSPVQDAKFSYSTALARVTLRPVDLSGIDSVRIGGTESKKVDSSWSAEVLLGQPGSSVRITVTAWDKAGNRTDSVLRLIRAELPSDLVPEFRLVTPSRKVGVHVPWDSGSVWIRWVVSDLSGIDSASVRINNQSAVRENDSTWGLRVPLSPLVRQYIPITATNRKGNAQAEVVEITRDGESSFPTVSRFASSKDTVLLNDSTFEVSWTIADNALESVRIAGTPVQGTGSTFTRKVPIKPGLQWLHLEATDSSKNTTKDSLRILSLPGMKRVEGGWRSYIQQTLPTPGTCRQIIDSLGKEMDYCTPGIPGTTTVKYWFIDAFLLDSAHTTQAEFLTILGYIPPQPPSINSFSPVTNIRWTEAVRFCNRKSILRNLDPAYDTSSTDSTKWQIIKQSNGYRIPTDNQFYISQNGGDSSSATLNQYGENECWFSANSDSALHPGGTKAPNKFGIYDIQGNAFHWTMNETSASIISFAPSGSSYLSQGKELSKNDRIRITGRTVSPEIGFRTLIPLSAKNLNVP